MTCNELSRDWVVLLSSEPRAESEKVKLCKFNGKKEERLGLREKGLILFFARVSALVPRSFAARPSHVLSNYDLLDSKRKIRDCSQFDAERS